MKWNGKKTIQIRNNLLLGCGLQYNCQLFMCRIFSLSTIPVFVGIIHHPFLFKTQRFRNWILSLSSDETYSVESNQQSQTLVLSIGPNWVGFAWRWRQNPVSKMFCILNKKNRTMDNLQNHNKCINRPSSWTFRYSSVWGLLAYMSVLTFFA
jgi:hypothetical protein